MKKIFTLTSILLFSTLAFGWAGEWEDSQKIESIKSGALQVWDVKIDVYNYAETAAGKAACGGNQCYRMDVFINDEQIATWATSPGYRRKTSAPGESKGSYSPIYDGHRILTHYGRDYLSYTKKYNMRYAMYIEKKSQPGKISNIAFHGKYTVTGKQESHGCFRMRDREAAPLNSWVRKAFNSGGTARVWSRGTRVRYYKFAQPVG